MGREGQGGRQGAGAPPSALRPQPAAAAVASTPPLTPPPPLTLRTAAAAGSPQVCVFHVVRGAQECGEEEHEVLGRGGGGGGEGEGSKEDQRRMKLPLLHPSTQPPHAPPSPPCAATPPAAAPRGPPAAAPRTGPPRSTPASHQVWSSAGHRAAAVLALFRLGGWDLPPPTHPVHTLTTTHPPTLSAQLCTASTTHHSTHTFSLPASSAPAAPASPAAAGRAAAGWAARPQPRWARPGEPCTPPTACAGGA